MENEIILSKKELIRQHSLEWNDEYLENWIFRYQFVLGLLCNSRPPAQLIKDYLLGLGNEGVIPLQEWCVNNTHIPWVYGINIIDAVDILVLNKE